MTPETQNRINDRIRSFINHWLKEGQVIQPSWQFMAKDELLKIAQFSYYQGKEDEHKNKTGS